MRRLGVLVRYLPPESPLWEEVRAEHERAQKPTVERIRERQKYYDNLRAGGA